MAAEVAGDGSVARHHRWSRAIRPGERQEAVDDAASLPKGARLARWHDLALRAVNIVVAVACLVLLSPLILVIALAIKLDSPGPIFYRQLRVGLDRRSPDRDPTSGHRTRDLGGRPFVMYKFRTMHVNAEADTGPVWATQNDGRRTHLGRFLRRHRFDEIPQFWNVLKGDMSVVGPRPERPGFVQALRDQIDGYALRQRVPPGITGWAQVNRSPDQSVEDVRRKLEYDLEYLERRSLWFDLQVMLRTVVVVTEPESPAPDDEEDIARSAEEA